MIYWRNQPRKRYFRYAEEALLAAGVLVLAAVLAVLAWALIPAREIPSALESLDTSMEDVRDWDKAIAYVPLDDRTDNMEDVVYLAEASGYQLVLPDGDIYCTKLDGQEPNRNGTQYGDREALMTWVREMDRAGLRPVPAVPGPAVLRRAGELPLRQRGLPPDL